MIFLGSLGNGIGLDKEFLRDRSGRRVMIRANKEPDIQKMHAFKYYDRGRQEYQVLALLNRANASIGRTSINATTLGDTSGSRKEMRERDRENLRRGCRKHLMPFRLCENTHCRAEEQRKEHD